MAYEWVPCAQQTSLPFPLNTSPTAKCFDPVHINLISIYCKRKAEEMCSSFLQIHWVFKIECIHSIEIDEQIINSDRTHTHTICLQVKIVHTRRVARVNASFRWNPFARVNRVLQLDDDLKESKKGKMLIIIIAQGSSRDFLNGMDSLICSDKRRTFFTWTRPSHRLGRFVLLLCVRTIHVHCSFRTFVAQNYKVSHGPMGHG